ncbi:TMEM175 family protein [Streptococcus thoraltensis]|nr:TMEM175 family protein [Streptococcus thoraltensis]
MLELDVPEAPTLTALLAISNQVIAYLVSFFCLSVMWVNFHNE